MINAAQNCDYFNPEEYSGYTREVSKEIYKDVAEKMRAGKVFSDKARPMIEGICNIKEYLALLADKEGEYYKLHTEVFGEGEEARSDKKPPSDEEHRKKRNKFSGWPADDFIAAVIFWLLALPEGSIHKVLEYIPYVPGDSDTIGCVVGSFIGAYLGEQELKERIDQKENNFETLEKYAESMKLAEKLAEIVYSSMHSDEKTADPSGEDTVSLHDGKELEKKTTLQAGSEEIIMVENSHKFKNKYKGGNQNAVAATSIQGGTGQSKERPEKSVLTEDRIPSDNSEKVTKASVRGNEDLFKKPIRVKPDQSTLKQKSSHNGGSHFGKIMSFILSCRPISSICWGTKQAWSFVKFIAVKPVELVLNFFGRI
jgi:hypothetical protein